MSQHRHDLAGNSRRRSPVCPLMGVVLLLAVLHGRPQADDVSTGLGAPSGFAVTLYADDPLAHDIYSLTIDTRGRVVVAGRGYVRILLDEDGDGTADSFRQFADGPANGAMGMFWQGSDLICTGDDGLLRYRDADGDDRADGPPTTLLEAKTGGEHDIHAIRKGPDGWWYLLGGNAAGLDERYSTLASSPVATPDAGALLRLKPDFEGSEVVADGFRNPYDFAFGADGRLFTYDSDGERDVSLPWYRPTRVFEILPGASAGWLSRSWKRPDHAFDMPPVAAAFGRGSPTGVEAYRHTHFPQKYRGGLFVLDWTYGRVMFVPAVASDLHRAAGESPTDAPEEFLTGVGSFGFAPTDAAVGPDGSLFVSVGGRGTRGGVYRIRWKGGAADRVPQDPLQRCLQAPQPLSSWSRAEWEPIARKLGRTAFQQAALDATTTVPDRVRAIEILTELSGGVDAETVRKLVAAEEPLVRARTAWMIGRTGGAGLPALIPLLEDREPLVVRATLAALLVQWPAARASDEVLPAADRLAEALSTAAAHPDRYVRQSAGRLLSRVDDALFAAVRGQIDPQDWPAQMALGYAEALRQPDFSPAALDRAVRCLRSAARGSWLEASRIAQLALGDVGPGDHPPVFDGYARSTDLRPHSDALAPLVEAVVERYPTDDPALDRELTRLLAIARPDDPAVLELLLSRITHESDPVEDIHLLIVAARLPILASADTRTRLADALIRIDGKIESRMLHRDLNWDDRIGEMFAALADRDPLLPAAVVSHDAFGEPGHVYFAEKVEGTVRDRAVDALVARASSHPEYGWTSDVVRFLAPSADREDVRKLLRTQVDNFALSAAVLKALAASPRPQDRPLLIDGLQSADLDVLQAVLQALEQLDTEGSPGEQVTLVRTLRRLGESAAEERLKQRALRQLQRNAGRVTDGARPEADPVDAWTDWVRDRHPEAWAAATGTALTQLASLQDRLEQVDWSNGDPRRGELLFVRKSCQQCHGGRRALGPDLTGVARRFSREDLFTAIATPNRDVSPRYQTTLIVTGEGQAHTGIIIYESIDGLLLRDSQGQTIRIEADQIDVRRQLTESLMPTGLLDDLAPRDLADLHSYLATID